MFEIEEIVRDIEILKPASHIAQKVLEVSLSPDGSLSEVVDLITYDQATTANLLKICNSSYMGLAKKMTSVKQAVAYLGLEKVANLVVLSGLGDNFRKAQSGYDLQEGELWRYSVASAILAQDLAEKRDKKNASLIFTAALVKDVGKVILSTYVRDVFPDIMGAIQEKGMSFNEAEKEIIGIEHSELGAMIAEKWNFAPVMVNIIRNHHFPEKAPPGDLTIPIVYLADSICMMIGTSAGSDGLAYRYHQEVVDGLGLSNLDLQRTIIRLWEKMKVVEELVDLTS